MKISLTTKPLSMLTSDLLIIFVTPSWKKEVIFLDKETLLHLGEISIIENFTGKAKQTLTIHDLKSRTRKILLFGIGEKQIDKASDLSNIVARALQLAKKLRRKKIALLIHPSWNKTFSSEKAAQIVSEASELATYSFDKYKGEEHQKEKMAVEELILITTPPKVTAFEKGIKIAEVFTRGVVFTRDLVNEPPTVTTPNHLAKVAQTLGKTGHFNVKILEKEQIEKLGMGCFLGVAKGSLEAPKFIILRYKPRKPARKKIVLVGKGITFDTGGLSLKPSQAMETMKLDMAGAATVLGIFSVLAEIKPDLEIIGLIAACENMPSGHALHPGDILRGYSGKTVEIINTDAEGRLTLSDCLSFAVKDEKADIIIDIATLTGAMMVALGSEITGFFTNEEELANKLVKASQDSGELIWRMPLHGEYKENIKSDIADLRNSSKSRYGGAINAALFLEEFVDKTPWIHLDIAGPAYAEENTPLIGSGGTGVGVRLLLTLLTNL